MLYWQLFAQNQAGAGFQIYDPNGELVTMTFTYPEVTTIDTFYTTADGDLITPQTLEYGKGGMLCSGMIIVVFLEMLRAVF